MKSTKKIRLFGQGLLKIKVGGDIDTFTFRAASKKAFYEIMEEIGEKIYGSADRHIMVTDPRPDLGEDSDLWSVILTVACWEEDTLYEKLREFRLAGCRLAINHERRNLAFNFGTEADEGKKTMIKQYAQEHKAHIKDLFIRIYRGIAKAEGK